MEDPLFFTDATEMAAKVRGGELSPVDLVGAHLDRIALINPKINAIATLVEDALDQARDAEAAAGKSEFRGPLHGVPVTVKDVFDTAGLRSTRGSLLFSDLAPDADATAVARLKSAGAILIGKTNTPEFALRAETSNRLFGCTLHPYDADRTCGGSSGGEAAAIAAGLSPLGIGTDLGGSNRLPSHYCGIVGLKATHGRIPLTGSWPALMGRHMHVGPLCRTVRDAALALEVLSGPDQMDPWATTAPWTRPDLLGGNIAGLRVGFFEVGPFAPVDPQIRSAVVRAATVLAECGAVIEEVDFDWGDCLAIDVCMAMVVGEGEHYLRAFVAGRENELTEQIAGLLALPPPALEDFLTSMDKRDQLAADVTRYFEDHDILLCPTSPTLAHGHDAETLEIDGREAGVGHAANITATFGMTGSPAISVPFATSSEGLPIGVQVVADHFQEPLMFEVAAALEEAGEQTHPAL